MKLTSLIIPAVLLYAFTRTSSAGGGSPPAGTPPSTPVIPVPAGVFNPTNAPAVVNTPAAISQFNKTSAIVWVENQLRSKEAAAGLPALDSQINALLQRIGYQRAAGAPSSLLNSWQDQLTSLRSQYYAIDKPLRAQMMADIAAINAGTWGGAF